MRLSEKETNQLKLQVQREYNLSYSTIVRKRLQFRQQDALLNGIQDLDKLDTKALFYSLISKMSIVFSDDIVIKWLSRQQAGIQQADRLNKLARFDNDEMELPIMMYEVHLNRLMRGVGLRLQTGWDEVKKVPKWQVMDTRTWAPDPRGWFDPKGFRFHGFELSDYRYNLTEKEGFYDLDKCFVVESSETILTRSYAQRAAALNPTMSELYDLSSLQRDYDKKKAGRKYEDNGEVAVYYHITRYNGRPVFTVWGNNINQLIKYEEIQPVGEEEKADPRNIPFPVILNHYCPKKGDPYGTSLVDLVQGPYRYENIMANLMFIREKEVALGSGIIYDDRIVKNINDVAQPTLKRSYTPGNGIYGPMSAAFAEIPKAPTSPSTYNFMDKLSSMRQDATGIDARQMGISGGPDVTLGEAQQLQANNNLRSLFEIRINNQGEKQFWMLWLRAYRQNFKDGDVKVIRVSSPLGQNNVEFTKKDLISSQDPDVEIKSKVEIENERQKQIAQLTPTLMAISVDPEASKISRTMAKRKLLELANVELDEQLIYASPSAEESDARDKIALLNENDILGAKIDPEYMDVDHQTYEIIFTQALPTPATIAAIKARRDARIKMGLQKQSQETSQGGLQTQAQNLALQNANTQQQSQNAEQTRANVHQ